MHFSNNILQHFHVIDFCSLLFFSWADARCTGIITIFFQLLGNNHRAKLSEDEGKVESENGRKVFINNKTKRSLNGN